jgi:Protein of unknown function (DUF3237)
MTETPLPLRSKYLMSFTGDLGPLYLMGARAAAHVIDGRFSGPRLSGKVVPGGGDWPILRADGSAALDVRITLEADDGGLIYMTYLGRMVLPPDVAGTSRAERAQMDPSRYYFRTLPIFETAAKPYLWLNNIVAVGIGRVTETGVAYDVHEIE